MSVLFDGYLMTPGNLPTTPIYTAVSATQYEHMVACVRIRPLNAALLSAVTFNVRWNDGAPQVSTILVLLSSLLPTTVPFFFVSMAPLTNMTVDAVLTGLGTAEVVVMALL